MAISDAGGVLLGPLTTTWTIPEACSIFMEPCLTCGQGFRAQSCNPTNNGRVQDNTACWPPVTSGVTSSPSWPFNGWGFYSPGLVCPAGYTTACTAVYGQRPQWNNEFTLVPSETAVGCCPSGFTCTNQNGNTCMATITQSTSVSTGFCDGTDVVSTGVLTFPNVVTITQTETTTGSVTVESSTSTVTMVLYAPMIQLNFHSSDLPASTTAASTSTTTSTTISTTTSTTTSSSSQQQSSTSAASNDTSSKSSGGLSSGAKVGLGVGISLGVAFLLAFSAFIYYYRRARNAQLPLRSELPNNQIPPEVDQGAKIKHSPAQIYEMGVYHAPAELPGNALLGDNEGGYNEPDAHRFA